MLRCMLSGGIRRAALQAAALLGATLVPAVAQAHFFLDSPPNWVEQDDQGDPQKTGPCGNEPTGKKTNIVTPYVAGDKVTIEFHETVGHPGHFRVALATDGMTGLADPATTNMCANTTVQDPPVFPVLADGVLKHTSKLAGMQTIEVTLPTDVTCENCTLQVLQYMSNSGNSCWYHHCATISISAPAGAGGMGSGGAPSGGAPSGGAGGTGGTGGQGMGGMSVASGGVSGTLGQGGMATSSGGTPSASGGQASGVAGGPGSGGSATAAGGMAPLSMGGQAPAAGGMPGTGGTTGGTGITAGGAAPTGSGGATEPPAEEGGCSLAPGSAKPSTTLLGLAGALAPGLALARRRRR